MIKTQPVICLETGEKFESFNECARAIGVPRSTLYNAVTKGHATRGHVEDIIGVQRSDFDVVLADASYRRLADLIEPEPERTCGEFEEA